MHKLLRPTLVVPFAAGIVLGAMLMGGAGAAYLGSVIFADVPSGSFYDAAVGEMYGLGIIKGYSDGRFGPDDYVTRGQVAVMFKRLRDEINGVTPSSGTSSRSSRAASSSLSSSSSSQATVTTAGGLHFTTSTFSVPDSLSSLTVSVVRSNGSRGEVTVAYALSGGTAIAGTDYSPTSGTLTFANNETTKNISLRFITNSTATTHRTINLILSNPTNGAVLTTPSSAVITLIKSGVSLSSASSSTSSAAATSSAAGGIISFSASTFSVMENAGVATVTVTRSGASSAAATVGFSMTNGSAKDGTHFTKNSGTLTFAAGETTQTFTVAILDNTNVDGSKSATLTLSNPTGGAALITPSTATFTILDDESFTSGSGSIRFAVSTYTVKHNEGYAFVAVNRGGSVTGTASVTFETVDNTAHNLADYNRTTGTVTFVGNETQKIIAIPLIARTAGAAGDKQFSVRLGAVSGNAVLGTLMETTVTITD